MKTLERLIHPTSLKSFMDEYWEKKTLVVNRENPDYYKEIIDLDDIDNIISSLDLNTSNGRLYKGGEVVMPPGCTMAGRPNKIDKNKLLNLFSKGHTVILSGIHENCYPLLSICRDLGNFFPSSVATNLLLNTPKLSGIQSSS